MRPVTVTVHWSESERFRDGETLPFADFELRAQSVAAAHKTGGYLKTNVTVLFDNGDTYGARLDLGIGTNERCFREHIESALKFMTSAAGEARMQGWGPGRVTDDCRHLIEVWKTMDFSPAPAPFSEELTPIGIQLVIPGCDRVIPPKPDLGPKDRQMSLFN